jgi:carbon storage regulator
MLVVTRRLDESIVINDNIVVTVLGIEGDKIKIGISAPRDIPILRQELWQAVNDQNRIAEVLASGVEPTSFQSLRDLLSMDIPQSEPETTPLGPDKPD